MILNAAAFTTAVAEVEKHAHLKMMLEKILFIPWPVSRGCRKSFADLHAFKKATAVIPEGGNKLRSD